jgi:hypothetical protein
MKHTVILVSIFLALTTFASSGPDPVRLWDSIPDDVYLQEVGTQIETGEAILSIAVHKEEVYVALASGIKKLEGEALAGVESPGGSIQKLWSLQDTLYLSTDSAFLKQTEEGWRTIAESPVSNLCVHRGEIVGTAASGVFTLKGDSLAAIENGDTRGGAPIAIESYAETLYLLFPGRLILHDGERFQFEDVIDWGELPSRNCRDMLSQGSRLLVTTDRGVAVLRGMSMTVLTGEEGLCYEDTTCLAHGFAEDLWIGTARGAIRHVEDEFQYFGADRWLPGDRVNAIACGKNVVYIGTDKGLGIVEYVPYTLEKKAAYYDRHLEEWGQKRLGFVHKLEWKSDTGEWIREVSDNDVGWSTHYLAAMCFKYAVTGDPKARAEAVNFFESMKWSEEITPIDGFPARSIWARGEKGHQAEGGSGGFDAEWHPTEDGVWEWKSDTSSDEIDAHFYAVSIFHDLVAQGREREQAKEHAHRVASHIYDNGWYLKDLDGKPTRWGRWEPEYLQRPIGYYARGLNGMEVLMFMRTAARLTGDKKFEKAYRELLDLGYHNEVLRQKLTFPPPFVFHSDDRLAFYAYYPLLMYETDPHLRSIYRRSLERSWEIERIEHNPWFNFIYGALTGNDCETSEAVEHLREWPLDLVKHSYTNSHRDDIRTPQGYVPYSGGVRPFSPRERNPHRWSDFTLSPDGGSGGGEVEDPSGWLDAYWMGRYYGFIEAPTTRDPDLLTVPHRGLNLGAEPYNGPPRPPLMAAERP